MWDGTARNVKPQGRGEEMKPVSDERKACFAVTINCFSPLLQATTGDYVIYKQVNTALSFKSATEVHRSLFLKRCQKTFLNWKVRSEKYFSGWSQNLSNPTAHPFSSPQIKANNSANQRSNLNTEEELPK